MSTVINTISTATLARSSLKPHRLNSKVEIHSGIPKRGAILQTHDKTLCDKTNEKIDVDSILELKLRIDGLLTRIARQEYNAAKHSSDKIGDEQNIGDAQVRLDTVPPKCPRQPVLEKYDVLARNSILEESNTQLRAQNAVYSRRIEEMEVMIVQVKKENEALVRRLEMLEGERGKLVERVRGLEGREMMWREFMVVGKFD